ncbi:MAG: cytochrome c [Gammaproteobacteria bacterium]|uniref:Cytochrome c n=1 Tax=Candidatus Thiopontia autotrophica TaxID=2841688 RepID=A0A8J6P0J4_9GAMM|nr:cytochrome c [Candidatus Thiopontia autotrophica]MBL6969061.1 cytochrome c [Gammaproteobacteria bacterium]
MVKIVVLLLSAILLSACDFLDPEKVRARNFLPAIGYQASVVDGKASYQAVCARCHGSALNGGPEGPPLLDRTYAPSHHADLAFFHAVKNGVRQHHWKYGDMPMLTGISPEQVGDIVAFVREEQQQAGVIK